MQSTSYIDSQNLSADVYAKSEANNGTELLGSDQHGLARLKQAANPDWWLRAEYGSSRVL
jgi:hypothetical protein